MAEPKKTQKESKSKTNVRAKAKAKSMTQKQMGTTSGATQRVFPVAQTVGPASPNAIIQIDKCLQVMNRRIYRQNKVYRARVELDSKAVPGQPGSVVEIYVLKNTWANRKAFALAKEMYDKAVSEERAAVGNARWQDFRVNASGCFNAASDSTLPIATQQSGARAIVPLGNGEYTASTVSVTNSTGTAVPTTFTLNAATAPGEYSVFLEFANNGPRIMTDPGAASPGGYERVTGTSYEDGNVQDLLDNGNFPPYDTTSNQSVLSGGPWQKVGELFHNISGESQLRTDYFDAPLGIVVAVGYSTLLTSDASIPAGLPSDLLTIRCKDGDYKGVAAEDI